MPGTAPPRGLLSRLLHEGVFLLDGLVSLTPGRTGQLLRHAWYRRRLKRLGVLGTGAMYPGIEFTAPENIAIGDNFICLPNCRVAADGGSVEFSDDVSLASNVVVDAGESGVIRIGRGSGVAHNCVLRASAHNYADKTKPFKAQGHKPGTIVLEDDVWVAANCVLLPGTHLESGVIVASGSVVGGRVAAFTVVAGNPARVVSRRE